MAEEKDRYAFMRGEEVVMVDSGNITRSVEKFISEMEEGEETRIKKIGMTDEEWDGIEADKTKKESYVTGPLPAVHIVSEVLIWATFVLLIISAFGIIPWELAVVPALLDAIMELTEKFSNSIVNRADKIWESLEW